MIVGFDLTCEITDDFVFGKGNSRTKKDILKNWLKIPLMKEILHQQIPGYTLLQLVTRVICRIYWIEISYLQLGIFAPCCS